MSKVNRLLWIDLEMTGLNVENEVIIEAAAIATDLAFEPLAEYHAVVKQPQSYIDGMDAWNTEHHGKSGLTSLVPTGTPPEEVDQQLADFTLQHCGKEPAILAGNSIYMDRQFINRHFKSLAKTLHYRMLDVSSFKILFKNKWDIHFQKKEGHRALDDIKESIEELKLYCKYIQIST